MCGICGKIGYGQVTIEEELLEEMLKFISYRGPDDQGTYHTDQSFKKGRRVSIGLGHKRLSIIDLSSAGHQPMSNEDGSIWITYNGEIYNFKQLKNELIQKGHIFKSETDTEVVLHSYEEKGIDAVADP